MPLFVTVTPGTTVTSSTTLDASTLNLLGTPSVDVTGSVDGGSLTLGSNSVSTTSIQNDAVIESKILNGSITDAKLATNSVIAEKISAGAVTTTKLPDATSTTTGVTFPKIRQISTGSILGRVSSGSGSIEIVNIGSGLSTTRNLGDLSATSLVKKNIGGTTADVDTITFYTSNDLDIPTDVGSDHAASLVVGAAAYVYDCYFKCTTAENGYGIGDIIKYNQVYEDGEYANYYFLQATAGSVKLLKSSFGNPRVYAVSTGLNSTFNPANWKAIITATKVT